jgi:hypothetical protein
MIATLNEVNRNAQSDCPLNAPLLSAQHASAGYSRAMTGVPADAIAKLVGEMEAGTKHHVNPRYVDEIVEVGRDRLSAETKA